MLLASGSFDGSITRAGTVTYDWMLVDIQESFGSGANETMLVVDWKSGTTPSYAWLYNWSDPATTMDDALRQVATSEPSVFQYSAPEDFVVELNYFDGTKQHIGNTQGWIWSRANRRRRSKPDGVGHVMERREGQCARVV